MAIGPISARPLEWNPPKAAVSRVPYLPGLDGMRALAVVAVMVYHANHEWLQGGFLGVEVFFVISGYLITLLLIAEHERSGLVKLGQFWLRRFRRLLPALWTMLALLAIYLAVFYRDAQGRTRGDIVGGLVYTANWYQIFVGAGYTSAEAFAPLRHLWSLAVEEQFYLVWPLIMIAILARGRAHLPRVGLWLFGIALFITLVMAVLFVPGDIDSTCSPDNMHGYWMIGGRCISINDWLYLGSFSRAGGLMLGAGFAMLWRPVALMRGPMRDKGRQLDLLALVGVVVLGLQMWVTYLSKPADTMLTGSQFDPKLFRGGFFITGLATLAIIAAVTHQRAMAGRLLGNPVCNWIGTRSYGLYLYHWPVYQIIRKQAGIPLTVPQLVLAMAITLPLTEASYRLIELPIRQGRIGQWLRRERRRPSPAAIARRQRLAAIGVAMMIAVGFASVSIAMAPNQCVGVVECANEEGAKAQDTQSTIPGATVPGETLAPGATAPPATADPALPPESTLPGETAPPTTLPTETVPPTTVPVAERPPLAVGESVMLGAVTQLQAGGFFVNAAESRQGEMMAEVIGQHKAAGEIGKIVVVHAGTNGPISQATYDKMMTFLTDVEQVVFLTVHADRGWIAGNNAIIYGLPARYPNVSVLDWDGLVSSGAIPGMAADGIHLGKTSAKQTYANYIFDQVGLEGMIVPVEG